MKGSHQIWDKRKGEEGVGDSTGDLSWPTCYWGDNVVVLFLSSQWHELLLLIRVPCPSPTWNKTVYLLSLSPQGKYTFTFGISKFRIHADNRGQARS